MSDHAIRDWISYVTPNFRKKEVVKTQRVTHVVAKCSSVRGYYRTSKYPILPVIRCDVPTFPTAVNSSCEEDSLIDYGTQCLFSCVVGYELLGESTLACLSSGFLSSDLPMCESK